MMKGHGKTVGGWWAVAFWMCLYSGWAKPPLNRYEIAVRLSLPVPVHQAVQPASVYEASTVGTASRQSREIQIRRRISELLIEAIIQIESAGNATKVGSRGERGLMQIMRGTWNEVTARHFGRRIPFARAFDPDWNRRVGTAYLADLQEFLARHRSLWKADERALLLACYNAGPERVRRAGFDLRRLPASTRDYVRRGIALHEALLEEYNVPSHGLRLAMHLLPVAGDA